MPRTLVNRIWQRLLGRGIVANVDEMDGEPWSPALLDWLASDFVEHGYDLKHLIETIVTSRTYQMPAVRRDGRGRRRAATCFRGPEVRRLTAEQFADAIGVDHRRVERAPRRCRGPPAAAAADPRGAAAARSRPSAGVDARDWRAPSIDADARARPADPRSGHFDRAPTEATTPQALELINGEVLTRWLARGAQRMIGELPAEPLEPLTRRRRPECAARALRHRLASA